MKLCIMVLVYSSILFGQVNIRTNFVDFVDSLIAQIPDTDFTREYKTPQTLKLNTWENSVQLILNGNYPPVSDSAQKIDYNFYRLTDTTVSPSKDYYALLKTSGGTNYWGIFIYNPSPVRQKLFIQSPHPKFDTFTGKQSALIFKNLGCRALFISGAHRCNNDTLSTCAGTTSVCGGVSTSYRISDQAHVVNSTLYRSTVVMNNNVTGLIVIQPHGFSQDPGDPDLIMSNGTRHVPSPDYLTSLKANLLSVDDTLEFKIAHIDSSWTELIGTTNVQGRYINGSGNPCNQSASSTSGRFLHIEQAYKLRNTDEARQKLSTALAATFGEDPLPVELSSFSFIVINGRINLFWRTETEINNYGFEIERSVYNNAVNSFDEWDVAGFVGGAGSSSTPREYSFTDYKIKGASEAYIRYRLKQIDNDGSVTYSQIITIENSGSTPGGFELLQNYPNPFNPETIIEFRVPSDSYIKLELFNARGELIQQLFKGFKKSGIHTAKFNGKGLSSGVYFYRLSTPSGAIIRKMMLLK